MNPKQIGKAINVIAAISPSLAQKISFLLFTSPRPRKAKPKEQKFLETAKKETVSMNGQQVATYSWGNADKKVLFAHGWESNAGRWRSFVPMLLEKGFQVVAFDAPGHGASEGKRLHLPLFMSAIQAVSQRHGPFYTIIGHSMGAGATVLAMSEGLISQPPKVVLLGSFVDVSGVYKNYEEMLSLTPKLEKEFNKTIKRLSGKETSYFSVPTRIKDISLDTQGLVVHDKQDTTIPIEDAQRIANSWKNSQYIETDGAGHSLQTRHIFRAVVDFINKN